jgi:hypothetical protein
MARILNKGLKKWEIDYPSRRSYGGELIYPRLSGEQIQMMNNTRFISMR